MTKIDKKCLIGQVAEAAGLTQIDARIGVEGFFSVIKSYWNAGKTLEIRGFGTFHTKTRKPRPAQNPKTGETIRLPKRRVPLLKFSPEIKKRINDLTVVTIQQAGDPVPAAPTVQP